jgi:hypothetical protein
MYILFAYNTPFLGMHFLTVINVVGSGRNFLGVLKEDTAQIIERSGWGIKKYSRHFFFLNLFKKILGFFRGLLGVGFGSVLNWSKAG